MEMKIQVNLYATLKRYMKNETAGEVWEVDVEDGNCVEDLVQKLEVPAESVKLIFVNGIHAKRETTLKDGDRLGIFPPVGGG
jgi:molybdopterin converting factor small subunit